jgi:hypothetical protein
MLISGGFTKPVAKRCMSSCFLIVGMVPVI